MVGSAMRVFLTGATGYIGSAVLDAVLRAGHQVTALVRDPSRAERLSARRFACMRAVDCNTPPASSVARSMS